MANLCTVVNVNHSASEIGSRILRTIAGNAIVQAIYITVNINLRHVAKYTDTSVGRTVNCHVFLNNKRCIDSLLIRAAIGFYIDCTLTCPIQ